LAKETQQIVVEILGRSLTLQSSMEAERLRAVAQMVDEHLRQLQKAFPACPLADLAILAALNLACESIETKEDFQQLQTEIDRRSRQLIERLEMHASYVPPGP
jgi:cell division protein ZapA